MSDFIQLHVLTAYPPANLNRDDLGRPKTAIMGGAKRLRISSQSLKRTWRTSDIFVDATAGYLGTRTRRLGTRAYERLVDNGVSEKKAQEWARQIARNFGKVPDKDIDTRQLVHVSPAERSAVDDLVRILVDEKRAPREEELKILRHKPQAIDIALFGRMLTGEKDRLAEYGVDAACQVAHAITVHAAEVEDDYFTAVDDLNPDGDRGAGHLNEAGFGAGLFYLYVCLDREQLIDNLGGDAALADDGVAALVDAITMTSPKGKQNSFGSRARASYVLAERGNQQPRALSVAFIRPVDDNDYVAEAVRRLERQALRFDQAYGPGAERRYAMAVVEDHAPQLKHNIEYGNLHGLRAFVRGDL